VRFAAAMRFGRNRLPVRGYERALVASSEAEGGGCCRSTRRAMHGSLPRRGKGKEGGGIEEEEGGGGRPARPALESLRVARWLVHYHNRILVPRQDRNPFHLHIRRSAPAPQQRARARARRYFFIPSATLEPLHPIRFIPLIPLISRARCASESERAACRCGAIGLSEFKLARLSLEERDRVVR